LAQDAAQVALVEDEHVVEAFLPDEQTQRSAKALAL
jgi:hypothetical protein